MLLPLVMWYLKCCLSEEEVVSCSFAGHVQLRPHGLHLNVHVGTDRLEAGSGVLGCACRKCQHLEAPPPFERRVMIR